MRIELISARPAPPRRGPPLLLLHGAWHGAWCWERAMADLAARGLECHAISARGHGGSDPAGWRTTIVGYLRDVRAALAALGGRPLLVGHSAGAYIAQLLLCGAVGPPPPLAGAVLLCSSPVSIGGYFASRAMRRAPTVSLPGLLRREPETVRAAFFRPETPAAEVEAHRALMVAEPPLVSLSSMLLRPRPERARAPVLVVAAERDAVFDLESQRAIAAAYRAPLVVAPGASHDLMLDPAWPAAAGAIAGFAAGLGG